MKDHVPANTLNNVHQTRELVIMKTGDKILESGHYYCTDGQHLDLNKGDLFPVCPNTGEVTIWKHSK